MMLDIHNFHRGEAAALPPTNMKPSDHDTIDSEHQIQAKCPSCGQQTRFIYSGEQHWPLRVAQALGVPEVITLWLCGSCRTTISELDLNF